MVLQNLQAIGNAVVARYDSLDKVLIEFLTFTIYVIVVFRIIGSFVDVQSLLLGVLRISNMSNKSPVLYQGTPQGLTEITQTGQVSKQPDHFLNSPYPDLGNISNQHESELRRAHTSYLRSSASAEGMVGKQVREFASDRRAAPALSGGLTQYVPEGILSKVASGF